MMCDKCGAKSADVELYCKNCGSDLQIFGAGAEKVKLTSEAKEEAPETPASPVAESPLGPPPSGGFPPPPGTGTFPSPPGSAPGLTPPLSPSPAPSPGAFGNIPGFPLSPSQPPEKSAPAPLSGHQDTKTNPEDVPSFISRAVPPSSGKPFIPPEEKGSGEPVDFSFLGKPSGQTPEEKNDKEENPLPPPAPPSSSPGAFSPDFFKPKEEK